MAALKKNLLIVSWAYPPLNTPRSIQVARCVKALTDHHWLSTIIRVTPQSVKGAYQVDASLKQLYSNIGTTIEIPSSERSLLLRAFWRMAPSTRPLPDDSWAWGVKALRKARQLLRSVEYSALCTFGRPMSDHLVGLQIRNECEIPWLAHFSDPWVDNPYENIPEAQKRKLCAMERDVIQKADAIVFVSRDTADLVMKKYPGEWRNKVFVIPHCFDPSLEQYFSKIKRNRKFTMIYTGNFYGPRSVDSLLTALKELKGELHDTMEVQFIGQWKTSHESMANELQRKGLVSILGYKNYIDTIKITSQADVLLLIDAPNRSGNPFLPSKLVDYLMYRKPILGITPLKGASADLLRKIRCQVADPTDVEGIMFMIRQAVSKWKAGKNQVPPDFIHLTKNYHVNEVGNAFNQILGKIITK